MITSSKITADPSVVLWQVRAEGGFYGYQVGDTLPVLPPTGAESISVSPRQFKQALTRVGLRTTVDAMIAAADQDTKDWYYEATEFVSDHPVVIAMCAAMNKTDEERLAVFQLAATL